MDKKKPSPGASASGGKHGEKKEENFLTKTAHSIRDKVHELADDVKEKTHMKKKDKDKNDNKSKHPTAGKKDSSSGSEDEEISTKTQPPPSASSGMFI
jgi:Tfp pilus assembly protein FimV